MSQIVLMNTKEKDVINTKDEDVEIKCLSTMVRRKGLLTNH